MKSTTVKALDNVYTLKAGEIYEVSYTSAYHLQRLIKFENVRTGNTTHLYKWEVEHARLAGRIVDHDDTQSCAMQASIASTVCAHLPSKFIY